MRGPRVAGALPAVCHVYLTKLSPNYLPSQCCGADNSSKRAALKPNFNEHVGFSWSSITVNTLHSNAGNNFYAGVLWQ